MDDSESYTTMWMYLVPPNCTVKYVKIVFHIMWFCHNKRNFKSERPVVFILRRVNTMQTQWKCIPDYFYAMVMFYESKWSITH